MPALLHRGARGCNAQAVALAGLRAGDDAIAPDALDAAHEDARPEQDHDDGEHDRATRAAANDHRYTARRVTIDPAPASTLYEEFHPFGTSSYAANDSGIEVSAKRYRYIGKERDEETGLYHLGARYYASWLGRWTAADPIGLGDGVNRYAYSHGNPIKLSDPGGTAAAPATETKAAFQQRRLAELDQQGYDRDAALEVLGAELAKRYPGATKSPRNPRNGAHYSPDRSGDTRLQKDRAKHQARLGAQYDANKKVADEVRARDGGAAGVMANVGFGFTPGGLLLDIRDIRSEWTKLAAGGGSVLALGVALVGLAPVVGDAAAAGFRAAGGLGDDVIEAGVKALDDGAVGTTRATVDGTASALPHGLGEATGGATFKNLFPDDVPGIPVTVTKAQLAEAENVFLYVVKEDGSLVIGPKRVAGSKQSHIDLAGGGDVRAAGEVTILRGRAHNIDNRSGHYKPKGASARDAALEAFGREGYNPNRYREHTFR